MFSAALVTDPALRVYALLKLSKPAPGVYLGLGDQLDRAFDEDGNEKDGSVTIQFTVRRGDDVFTLTHTTPGCCVFSVDQGSANPGSKPCRASLGSACALGRHS